MSLKSRNLMLFLSAKLVGEERRLRGRVVVTVVEDTKAAATKVEEEDTDKYDDYDDDPQEDEGQGQER